MKCEAHLTQQPEFFFAFVLFFSVCAQSKTDDITFQADKKIPDSQK